MINNKKGFTLIELLVVILIVGILAAVALPQYKRAVEKAKMAEAVIIVKAIAQSQQRYYLVHNKYVRCLDLDNLDIDLSGEDVDYGGYCSAKQTKNFLYTSSAMDSNSSIIAIAQRLPALDRYYINIRGDSPNKIRCNSYANITSIQLKLCQKLNKDGTL